MAHTPISQKSESQHYQEEAVPLAKHALVSDALRREIIDARMKPGARLASEEDLCERFGLSRGPIRQALATLEHEGLIYRVRGAGSFVADGNIRGASNARGLLRILVILGFKANIGIGAELIEALNSVRREIAPNCQLLFEFGFDHIRRFRNASATQIRSECDGLLVFPVSDEDMEQVREMDVHNLPAVSCFRRVDGARLPQVYIDQDEGAVRATEYLLRYGHRRIGLVVALEEDHKHRYDSEHRINGYREAFNALSVPIDASLLLETTWAMDSAVAAVSRLLKRPDRPTALMIGGSMLHSPVLLAIQQSGLRIPQDISVLAFDDSAHVQFNAPALTVVTQCPDKAARLALKQLIGQIDGAAAGDGLTAVIPELILRDSCRPR